MKKNAKSTWVEYWYPNGTLKIFGHFGSNFAFFKFLVMLEFSVVEKCGFGVGRGRKIFGPREAHPKGVSKQFSCSLDS